MKTHDKIADLLKSSRVLRSLGFNEEGIWYGPKGPNHHDLIVITKEDWKLPCSDSACGYQGVYLHFEYERPGVLLLHCELYPRQGSESKHPRESIQPLLDLKGGISTLIRQAGIDHAWSSSIGWEASAKELGEPKNLQVGKFSLGFASDDPTLVNSAIERIAMIVVPSVDPIMSTP